MLTQSEIDATLDAEWELQLMTETKEQLIYLYKKQILYSNNLNSEISEERQRAKVLLDALKVISRTSTTKDHCHDLAIQTLNTYNKNKPNDRE